MTPDWQLTKIQRHRPSPWHTKHWDSHNSCQTSPSHPFQLEGGSAPCTCPPASCRPWHRSSCRYYSSEACSIQPHPQACQLRTWGTSYSAWICRTWQVSNLYSSRLSRNELPQVQAKGAFTGEEPVLLKFLIPSPGIIHGVDIADEGCACQITLRDVFRGGDEQVPPKKSNRAVWSTRVVKKRTQ